MKYCVSCGEKALVQHHFCSACGHSFGDQVSDKPKQARYPAFVPNQDDISTYEHHLKYLNKLSSFQSKVFYLFFFGAFAVMFFTFTSVFSGWASVSKAFESIWLFPFCIISCIAIKFTSLDYWLAKQIYGRDYRYKDNGLRLVYQELPSAKNHKDEFICIFCGNKRFFRKGIYASDSCTVNCTKCQHYLYTE
ncbi:hypothetical protein [Acinetobacter sp. YH12218]|uniref:hypothetical protein n=1 Tax=Acinetobacter sp. YH12218 TaxID=2601152 RepID=UPI000DCF6796|nr:hypothetical protein [Acinetobacter sp. YH12218]